MGMYIEAEGKVTYTIELTDEDVVLVDQWIKEHCDDLPSFDMKENIAYAVWDLYRKGEISIYDEGKATESDFSTECMSWSEFEEREPEEILGITETKD